jgi:glycerol-3-phosphate acyltransferase PlsY
VFNGYKDVRRKSGLDMARNIKIPDPRMKRKAQQDATITCLLLTSVSTCFGHHYAHLYENKGPVTAFGVLFWFCWMWLVAVVGRCLVGCEQWRDSMKIEKSTRCNN